MLIGLNILCTHTVFAELFDLQPRIDDDISQSIMGNMKEIEKLLNLQLPAEQTDPEFSDVCSHLKKRPSDLKSQKYSQWAVQMIQKVNFGLT